MGAGSGCCSFGPYFSQTEIDGVAGWIDAGVEAGKYPGIVKTTLDGADQHMLPIGQALWMKELESYIAFPPMQDPASYNLEQVMDAIKKHKGGASE